MATDKLYKLTDEQSRWVSKKVVVLEGVWVPDPVHVDRTGHEEWLRHMEELGRDPDDYVPISFRTSSSSGGTSECEVSFTTWVDEDPESETFGQEMLSMTVFRCKSIN